MRFRLFCDYVTVLCKIKANRFEMAYSGASLFPSEVQIVPHADEQLHLIDHATLFGGRGLQFPLLRQCTF